MNGSEGRVRRNLVLGCMLAGLFTSPVWAFKLNPCMRILSMTANGPLQEAINPASGCGILDPQLQLAVHEHMTVAAIQGYGAPVKWEPFAPDDTINRRFDYLRAPRWSVGSGREHSTFDLIKGTWWNDDPLMYLWGQGLDFVKGLQRMDRMFSDKKASYAGGQDGCEVPAEMHLGYQSHYGGLQHLHFMSTLGKRSTATERVSDAVTKSLLWLEFAYSVATGSRAPDATFTSVDEARLGLPSVARNLCVKPVSVKVRSLFARTGAGSIAHRDRITPDVALGSMLHLLQDSFSPAHTCRVSATLGGQTVAALRDVYNYNEQDADDHTKLDVFPTWFAPIVSKQEHAFANDPVVVGTWLLGAVDRNLPWAQVQKHLLETVLAQASWAAAGFKDT